MEAKCQITNVCGSSHSKIIQEIGLEMIQNDMKYTRFINKLLNRTIRTSKKNTTISCTNEICNLLTIDWSIHMERSNYHLEITKKENQNSLFLVLNR